MLVGVLVDRWFGWKKEGDRKGNTMLEVIFWLIVAVLTLVIVIAGIVILFGKGEGMLSYLKDVWRFGG